MTIIPVGYIDELLDETIKVFEDADGSIMQLSEIPEPLCSGYNRPEKDIAIKGHKTRFGIL